LNWFHLAMRIHHVAQAAKGWPTATPGGREDGAGLADAVERIRWRLWHGQVRCACARRPSPSCSGGTASAGSTPRRARHPAPARDRGGRGRYRGRRAAPASPRRPAAPGHREVRQAEGKLGELCAALTRAGDAAGDGPRDAATLASLPGVGRSTLAALLTEAAGPLARRDYAALRTLSDVAPVAKRSGGSRIVVMRHAAQVRLRQAVFHWARTAVQNDPRSRGRYEALRARRHSYGRALRGVADRLLGVACILLRRQELFDPDHGTPVAA
jgi:transposase IS116/IS110/IS902 family protein